MSISSTRGQPEGLISAADGASRATGRQVDADTRTDEPSTKRQRLGVPATTSTRTNAAETAGNSALTARDTVGDEARAVAEELRNQTYWQSDEARAVFFPMENEDNVFTAVENRIKILLRVGQQEDGWRAVIAGGDSGNACTGAEIFGLRRRCTILCKAYLIAISPDRGIHFGKKTWLDCCQEACDDQNAVGNNQATNGKIVTMWNIVFRVNNEFPHPHPDVGINKKPVPALMRAYPEIKDEIAKFCVGNLKCLSIEKVHGFIHENLLGDLYDKWVNDRPKVNDEPDYAAYTMETFLDEHKLKELCLSTIWRWMKYLGMNYSARHKSFYVDGHEREDVVQDRENFCLKYLTQYEQKCLRWVQVKKSQAELIDGLDLTYGYEYTDDLSGEQWLEFHIDTVAPYI